MLENLGCPDLLLEENPVSWGMAENFIRNMLWSSSLLKLLQVLVSLVLRLIPESVLAWIWAWHQAAPSLIAEIFKAAAIPCGKLCSNISWSCSSCKEVLVYSICDSRNTFIFTECLILQGSSAFPITLYLKSHFVASFSWSGDNILWY